MRKTCIIVIAAVALFSTGCASVFKGTKQSVSFDSAPEGAEVVLDGFSVGTTPLTLKLKKHAYDTITIKKSGYATQTLPLETKYDGIALLNVFWDCSTTDLLTGAAWEYSPSQYYFQLKKQDDQ